MRAFGPMLAAVGGRPVFAIGTPMLVLRLPPPPCSRLQIKLKVSGERARPKASRQPACALWSGMHVLCTRGLAVYGSLRSRARVRPS